MLFGLCSCSYALIAIIPIDEVASQGAISADHMRAWEQFKPHSLMLATTTFVLGCVPGVCYLLLGFGVRRGQRGMTIASLILAMTQAIVCGLVLLLSLIEGFRRGEPLAITIPVLTFGTLLGLLVFLCVWLFRALRVTAYTGYGPTDPRLVEHYDPRNPWDDPQR